MVVYNDVQLPNTFFTISSFSHFFETKKTIELTVNNK